MSRWLDLIDGPGAVMKSPEPELHKLQKGGLRSLCSSEEGQTLTKTALADAAGAPVEEPAPTPPPATPDDLSEFARELIDERAALLEYDAGLTRPAAEAAASAMLPDMLAALNPAAAFERWLPVADDVEITRMAQRQQQAQALGLTIIEAERLADRLHQRDREQSGCTLCAECQHLRGKPGAWRCTSVVGLPGPLAPEFVHRLAQRCPGFDAAPGWPLAPAGAGADVAAALEPL